MRKQMYATVATTIKPSAKRHHCSGRLADTAQRTLRHVLPGQCNTRPRQPRKALRIVCEKTMSQKEVAKRKREDSSLCLKSAADVLGEGEMRMHTSN
ncbi:hypothetical protein EVAR_33379_1 [Eumeta japonica]|uniref:Uncharacterized protein n=1 Tax=Eumeta variegata TaxID=151549 RepID=A0A4C1X035_EUMVA|nr:hypothetical protein EVAR_33379_1 [Eumeta japonica]